MEETNGDNGERRENERLTVHQSKSYTPRTLSTRESDNYQVSFIIYSLFI